MKNDAITTRNYYPTDIGNTWVLETPDRKRRRTYTIETPETTNTAGLVRMRIVTELIGTHVIETFQYFVSVTPEGIMLHKTTLQNAQAGNVTAILSPPGPFLRLPLTLGDKWNLAATTKLKGILPAKIVTHVGVVGFEQVVTPAGTFDDCFKVELKSHITAAFVNIRSTIHQWLAPDVGPVKCQENGGRAYTLVNSYLLGETK